MILMNVLLASSETLTLEQNYNAALGIVFLLVYCWFLLRNNWQPRLVENGPLDTFEPFFLTDING